MTNCCASRASGRHLASSPLDALVTGFSLNPTGTPPSGGGGNPTLKPYKADQLDLSYEWYFHEESLFALAVYYKDVKKHRLVPASRRRSLTVSSTSSPRKTIRTVAR